jgi:hypothetical protein
MQYGQCCPIVKQDCPSRHPVSGSAPRSQIFISIQDGISSPSARRWRCVLDCPHVSWLCGSEELPLPARSWINDLRSWLPGFILCGMRYHFGNLSESRCQTSFVVFDQTVIHSSLDIRFSVVQLQQTGSKLEEKFMMTRSITDQTGSSSRYIAAGAHTWLTCFSL